MELTEHDDVIPVLPNHPIGKQDGETQRSPPSPSRKAQTPDPIVTLEQQAILNFFRHLLLKVEDKDGVVVIHHEQRSLVEVIPPRAALL